MKPKPRLLLQLALSLVFFYAGINIFFEPSRWIGFIPTWVEKFGLSRELALYAHAALDITVGVWVLSSFRRLWAGLSAFALLSSIVVFSGFALLPITFRDVGLALSALAYAFWDKS